MRLRTGENAPDFQVQNMEGVRVTLSTPRKKLLMLSFFRYASCPLCNLRVHELIKNHDLFRERVDVVAIFQSPAEKIRQYVGKQDIPFAIIPDPDKELYRLYRVESSWLGFLKAWSVTIHKVFDAVIAHRFLPGSVENELHRIPADFIIAPDNRILRSYYGKDIGDHLPLSEILKEAESYETG